MTKIEPRFVCLRCGNKVYNYEGLKGIWNGAVYEPVCQKCYEWLKKKTKWVKT